MTVALALLGARKFLVAHWQWFAAVAAALLLWHAIAVHDRAQWNAGFNAGWSQQHKRLLDEQQSHAFTRASLNAALTKISDQNAATDELAADGKTRLAASADAQKAAQDVAKPHEAAAKALDASARTTSPRDAPCAPSETFLTSMKDL